MDTRRILPLVPITLAIILAIAQENKAQPQASTPLQPMTTVKACAYVTPGSHERYRLPPPDKLPADISFASDWRKSTTGGWFGVQMMDGCRMQPDGAVTWHGMAALRVEVQPDDDPLALKANSERAEVLIMQSPGGAPIKETAAAGRQYYATSYYFPSTWQGQQFPWGAFAPVDCAANENQCNSWSFVWQFYGWGGLSAAQTAPHGPQIYRFNSVPFFTRNRVVLGKWTDFVFLVDWGTGSYRVWRRDEGEKRFTLVLHGATPMVPGREFYIKQGLYRGGTVSGRTDVLWIGPTARGSNFAAVERQAFGTEDGGEQ
jgi:hypothetical protein